MVRMEDPSEKVAMIDYSEEDPTKRSCCRCHRHRSAGSRQKYKCDEDHYPLAALAAESERLSAGCIPEAEQRELDMDQREQKKQKKIHEQQQVEEPEEDPGATTGMIG